MKLFFARTSQAFAQRSQIADQVSVLKGCGFNRAVALEGAEKCGILGEIGGRRPSGATEAAEKVGVSGEIGEEHPSVAKAKLILRHLRHD